MADTYTIQFRRGMYADFDTSKIRPGEPVAILGNDPSVPSGKALYIAFAANDVRRLCSIEDISEMVNAGEFVGPQGPKGEKGDKGDPGEKGADGTVAFESLTPEQKESLRGISIKSASVDTDGNLTIMFSDGDSEDVGNIMGPQGIQGPKGDKGDVGPQGLKGDKGDVGPKGDNMSDEQAQQIEQNKTDIASLKTETGSLKEDISTKITKFYASSQGETHLADSDNGKIQDMMLYGKSEQKQYSGKNLLNVTMGTTTKNGITCTANDDGTFTLNGTATASLFFIIINNDDLKKAFGTNEELRLTGAPKGASKTGYYLQIWKNEPEVIYRDTGGGVTAKKPNASCNAAIVIVNGTVFNNVLFKPMLTTDLTATYDDFEPYTGGIPSPNPDYPQEIKSVVNPTVKVSNEDGTQFKTVTLPYTLNAIPVSSGGNVTINGQQYIADYVDVERGKLVRMVDSSKLDNTQSIVNKTEWLLAEPQETDLTKEEIAAFKALATYYPTTNISVNSEQLDGYTVFNYPISMENGWNYVKQQIGDTRDYIYDMDARTQDTDLQAAEAYVNSEYAVALTELEV